MSEIEEDNTQGLEGELQIPNYRQKVFKTSKELGEWLVVTRPRMLQAQMTNSGEYLLMWRDE